MTLLIFEILDEGEKRERGRKKDITYIFTKMTHCADAATRSPFYEKVRISDSQKHQLRLIVAENVRKIGSGGARFLDVDG